MLKSQFSKMDKNGDKRCDRDEVQAQLIKWQISPKEFKTIFSAMDTNHDDYVSFKEYCHFWVEYHIVSEMYLYMSLRIWYSTQTALIFVNIRVLLGCIYICNAQ